MSLTLSSPLLVVADRLSNTTYPFTKAMERGSALTVVPFNQGSVPDGLSSTIYVPRSEWIPTTSSLSPQYQKWLRNRHRIMLVNLLRILGEVRIEKASRQFVMRPTQVILPLSPNHGLFVDYIHNRSIIEDLPGDALPTLEPRKLGRVSIYVWLGP
jgi:hypothetical protein